MSKINVLVVEDDPIWKIKLQLLLDELDVNIVDTAKTVNETIKCLEKRQPDVIVADLMLGNATIFDIYKHNNVWLEIPIIIVTTSDKEIHYNQTEKINRFMYLVKPIHKFTLKSSLAMVLDLHKPKNNFESSILIKGSKNEKIKLPFNQIIYIEQDGNYCYINTSTKQFVLKKSLSNFIIQLPNYFLQTHRSFCVNTIFIEGFNNTLEKVKLKNGAELPIGRINRENVKEFIAQKAFS